MSTLTSKYSQVLLAFLVLTTVCLSQSGIHENNDTLRFCFLSDTQEPLFLESLFLKYNNNALARKLIFEQIHELQPTSVFHLGDLVSIGFDNDRWGDIDQFVKTLHEHKIDFLPIPGNHEYIFFPKKSISNFKSRYPYARLTGYSQRYNNLAVVLFNSNFDDLSEDERNGQLHWYRGTLREYESDPSIDFIIIGCHHSPFTNSKIVSASKRVRDYYLPEYYESKKCKLFLSGHAHAYEHFRMNGKDFLVIGGGGGIQQPLRIGGNAEYQDIFSNSLEKRMFHFLTIKTYDDKLSVELKMLTKDFKGFENIPQLIFASDRLEQNKIRGIDLPPIK